jgi:RHS repeat-associated protein
MYPVDDQTAPQQSYTVAQDGTLTVQPALAFNFGSQQPDTQVVFTVKKAGALVAKKVIQITGGQLPSAADMQLTVPANAGDQLFFDFSTLDASLPAALTSESVQVSTDGGTTFSPAPSAFHGAAAEGIFGQPYRGWAAAGYNGNKDRATQPIVQADLTADGNFKNQVPASLDPQAEAAAFAADPRITPPNSVAFNPTPASNRWQAQPDIWVAPDSMSSSRQGTESVVVPTAADFAGATAVPKMSRCQQLSLTGSVSVGIGSLGGSIATGDCTGELDYLDMNGDGFPDVVSSGGIQYTDPTGALGATTGGLPDGSVRSTHQVTGNAGAGSAARTITTGRGDAAPSGQTVSNTAQSGNDMPPLGIGGDLSTGKSDTSFDLIDINGDGLPDRVYSDGQVALNLGYTFALPEPWPGLSALNDGSTNDTGLNIGFNTDFYGLAGGASFSSGRSTSKATLVDVNGDGKPDMVFDDGSGTLKVGLNTGTGFAPPVPYLGSLGGLNADANAQLGGGAYLEFHACFAIIAGCIIINPGVNFSTSTGRTEQEFRAMTGNGVPDMVTSTKDNQLLVAENTVGRTNLLESVSRPLGGSFALDYTRDGNTQDNPQSRFLLTRITVNDGQTTGGQDTELTTVRYAGGFYNRTERQFYGYRTVVSEVRDPGNNDALYRTITRTYLNDSYYTRGLLADELIADAAGRPFQETSDTYQLRDVATGSEPADGQSTTATIFPALVRTDKSTFEGQPQPGESTHTEMDYDQFGNQTRLFDAGDPGSAGPTQTLTQYTAADPACQASYIVGTANVVDISGDGKPMRHRESTVDCATGNVTQIRAMLADGTASVTDLSYFDNGNLQTVIGPPNASGQRYRLDYTYDTVTSSHVTSVTDSFGYTSSATYNLKYGLPQTTTDFNNQVISYAYDTVGRVASVTGPYEAAAGLATIQFEYHPEAAVPYAVTRHIDRNADGTVKPTTINIITFDDGFKRVIQTKQTAAVSTGPATPPADVMTVSGRVQFDFAGRVVAEYHPVTEPLGRGNVTFNPAFDSVQPTRTSYDILDRATRTGFPDGTFTTTSYGFGADRSGAIRAESTDTNANGVPKSTFRDIRGQITSVRQVNTDQQGNQQVIWTSYEYDPLGEQTKVIDDHGNITTMTYDNLGRRTAVDSPDSGRTETVYDLAGNAIQKITPNLAALHLAVNYDYQFTRLAAIRYPVFTGNDVTYTYGAPGAPNNGADRITEIHDASGVTQREYGPLGEVIKETRSIPVDGDVLTYTTQYQYDTWNRLQRLTYPDGEVLTYTYDSGGQVNSATGVKGNITYPYLTRLDYDKFGQRVLMTTGDGTTTSFTYNAANRRLQNLTATTPGGYSFQNTTYGYDNNGNVTSIENDALIPQGHSNADEIGGPSTQTFSYDSLDRLTSAQGQYTNDGVTSNQYQLSQSYDTINNITAKDQANQLVKNGPDKPVQDNTFQYLYSYTAAQPHAPSTVGPSAMTYDANGNLIKQLTHETSRQLIWDEENRLQCVKDHGVPDALLPQAPESCEPGSGKTTERNVYDDQGSRVVKDGDGISTSVYPNQSFSQRGDVQFKNIFVGPTRLITKVVNRDPGDYEGEQFYFHADQIGSTGFLTDARGQLIEHQEYFPSGDTWVSEHPSEAIPFQFTGHELDPETGFYYYGARYYNPRTGLWQSADDVTLFLPSAPGADPTKLAGTGGVYNPVNLNLYGYADQNPVTNTDANGHFAQAAAALCLAGPEALAVCAIGAAILIIVAQQAARQSLPVTTSAPSFPTTTTTVTPTPASDTYEWREVDVDQGRTILVPTRATEAEIARAQALVKALTAADTRDIPTYIIFPSMNVPQIAAFNLGVQIARPLGPGEIYNWIGAQSDPANAAKVAANRDFTCGAMGGSGNLACHEFPYASLLQGGAGVGGPPAVGGLVDATQNSREGGYWGAWVVAMTRAGKLAPGGPLRILNIPGGGDPPQP